MSEPQSRPEALPVDELLRIVVARSSAGTERLDERFSQLPTASARLEDRLTRWRQSAAGGDAERFDLRLRWSGWSEADANRMMSEVVLRDTAELPAWAMLLGEWVERFEREGPGAHRYEGFLDPEQPVPFEELSSSLVVLARERLAQRAAEQRRSSVDATTLVTPSAMHQLERSLLGVLEVASRETLLHAFDGLRGEDAKGLGRLLAMALEPESRERYDAFLLGLRRGELRALLERYPVLARIVGEAALRWVEIVDELLVRLAHDRHQLEEAFGEGRELGAVASVSTSLSDPHNGGRSVMALHFESGSRVVYKPKSLRSEEGLQELLAWINERGSMPDLRVLRVLDRESHGWVEFVEHSACASREELERYYQRAGMLLGLLWVLEATDCHFENLLAAGEHPVVIDAETLFHHRPRMASVTGGAEAQVLANEALEQSALRTGMLPHWEISKDNVAFDVSGFGASGAQMLASEMPSWEHINTDHMAIRMQPGHIAPRTNLPVFDDQVHGVMEHGEQLLSGFTEMCEFLAQEREDLLSDDGPLAAMSGQQVRFVFRPTRTYRMLLLTVDRKALTSGAELAIALDRLAHMTIPVGNAPDLERPDAWDALAYELQSLRDQDVPFFVAQPDSADLCTVDEVVSENWFAGPSFEAVRQRLERLDPGLIQLNRSLIQGSLYAHSARTHEDDGTVSSEFAGGARLTPQACVALARRIADEIADRAIVASDGGAAWIAPQFQVDVDRYQLQPVDYSLYGGSGGIAVFLAAVDRVCDSGHGDLALGALRPLRWALREQPEELANTIGIGGGSGLGSVVYSMVRVAGFLDRAELLEDAERLLALATDERIHSDRAHDLIEGAAGLLVAALTLWQATGGAIGLDRAQVAAQHLVHGLRPTPNGHRSWPSADGRFTTGMSHGAAGNAYALLRIYEATGDEEYLAAAREGIRYENSMYSEEEGTWADFQKRDTPFFTISWCHGAPGIGLARAAGKKILDDPTVATDIDRALNRTRNLGLRLVDQICCGNMGRVEVLLTAGLELPLEKWEEDAWELAGQVVARAAREGSFVSHPLLPAEVYNPSLFQGTAGIGYTLLRLARGRELPSVLAWG